MPYELIKQDLIISVASILIVVGAVSLALRNEKRKQDNVRSMYREPEFKEWL